MYIVSYCAVLRTFLLVMSVWLTGFTATFSQEYIFDVDVIGVEDGLPHRNTYDIVQDKQGFIWVSGLGNISRYDGYNFKTYNHTFLNIQESSTAWLALDKDNRLWYCERRPHHITLNSGVIDIRKDSVYSMESVSEGLFTSKEVLYVTNSKTAPGTIFIVTQPGIIYKYNGAFEEIYRFPHPLPYAVLCEAAPDGSYWIAYDKVINVKNGKVLKTIPINNEEQPMRLLFDHDANLILETFQHPDGGNLWKLENDMFVSLSIQGHSLDEITAVVRFHEDYICYATDEELLIRNTKGNLIYTFTELESLRLKQGLQLQDIFSDRQNMLWVSTGSGLLKINSRKNPFSVLEPGNSIRGIFREEASLWTGGYSGNTVTDIKTGSRKEFWSFTNATAISFFKDHQEHLWIGSGGPYLKEYIPEENAYKEYALNPGNTAHLMFQNAVTKNHWIGTNNGLFRLDKKTKAATPFPPPIGSKSLGIQHIYQNAQEIWIATHKGIFLMDAKTETVLKHYTTADGLPAEDINHLYEDAAGIFWLGVKRGGLIRWDRSKKSYRHYTRKNGLSNNNIYAVYEDDFNTLWLPSDYGLMAFDKNTETTKVYLPQNGIAHEEFNTYAHFQDKDGTLYFGGLNGVTKFHSGDLREDYDTSPPLYATKVQVLEKDNEQFTDKTVAYIESGKIGLNSNDRILELELTLLDYEKSDENQYAYKLSGKQEQWVYTGENKISIINPPYGKYDLVIKARGASGSWSENILTIPVYKPLPFYRQWWFILAFILTISVTVIAAVRWRVQKLKKDRQRLETEVQKRTRQIEQDKKTIEKQAEDLKVLDKAKSRFFTNITHEFRTPLTLITGPVEQIMANGIPATLKTKMQSVQHNAKHLLGLINQLLDISKLESGSMEVKASTADIVAFTGDLVQGFRPVAREKAQQLTFNPDLEQWETHFDKEKFSKIAYNLLSNAIKYTPERGKIEISLFKTRQEDREHIGIRVKDTGIGISSAAVPHIFDRFYQVDDSATRKGEGTGIGLALVKELVELQNGKISVKSEVGKGSVFTVSLPVLPAPAHPDTDFEPLKPEIPLMISETGTAFSEAQNNETSGANKLELLIIEDNAGMRNYIRSCMDASVYNIWEAANGEEGIKKAQELVPDLIISDIMMPKKDGFEVTHAIRNHIATSHIPIILLTAKASEESRLEGLERGVDAYLTKPFNPQELSLRVKKLIELRRLLQVRYQGKQLPQADPLFRKEDQFVSELKRYISEHISDPDLNVGTISRHFSISRAQFYRKLKALINISLNDYIRSIRLDAAMQMLKNRELTIAEVAYATGFSSPTYFTTTFKKVYGKPPSQL